MKLHPVAKLFPMLADNELQALASDIKANGLQQPCVMQGGVLLDGRNRLAACKLAGVEPRFTTYDGDSPVAFIIGVNLQRRHLTVSQKLALGIEIEPHFAKEAKKRKLANLKRGSQAPEVEHCPTSGGKSRDQAAAAVGVSGKTLSAAKAVKAASPEMFERIKRNELTVAKATRLIRDEAEAEALAKAQRDLDADRRVSLAAVCDLRVCSCAELLSSGIVPDAVITDPPYPQKYLPAFSELAQACSGAKVPLVAVMSGQSYLPQVMQRLCEHLTYRWTLAYMTPGGQAVQQWQAKVNTSWKPVLLFGDAGDWFGDVAISKPNDNDKRFHGWGQSESGIGDLVGRLTKPGQLVCDPFVGGGTTAVVSLALARRFVGCDIDADCITKTQARVEAYTCQK